MAVTPPPEMLIDVPAVVKLVPVKVTVAVVPCAPDVGEIPVRVGGGGFDTVKVREPLVPPAVVTVTFLLLVLALGAITKLAVTWVALTYVTLVTVTPVPLTLTASPAAEKLVPAKVTTATVFPRNPVFGVIDVSVGAGGLATMVKVTGAVTPPAVVTVTVRSPKVALPAIMKFVVIEVGLY